MTNGSLIINSGGILLLGAANQIGNAVPMTLGGGTFQTAGFSEQLGTLTLTAASVIDLGASATVLNFAASSGVGWTPGAILTVTNWNGSVSGGGAERLIFGSSSSGLASAQVAQIRFANPAGLPAGNYAAAILTPAKSCPLTAPALIGAGCSADGCFYFNLAGPSGCRYTILTSTNLSTWTVLQTNTSPFTFTDTNSTSLSRRFYRAQYLPGNWP